MVININQDWEWYENTNVFRLFTHCLLNIKNELTKWCGKIIEAGQFVSSIARISAETGLSISAVRTALKKLKDTGYITTESNNKYTVYTINEFKKFVSTTEENTEVEKETEILNEKFENEKETKKVKKEAKKAKKSEKEVKKASKKDINECFERLWKQYPNKRGKGQMNDAKKKKLFETGEETVERALQRYLNDLSKETWRKAQNGSTFFNSGYIDYLDENYEKPPEPKSQRNPASVLECERDYDFEKLEQQILQQQFKGDYFNESY